MEILTLGRAGNRPLRIRLLARTAIGRAGLESTIGAASRGWFEYEASGDTGVSYPVVDAMLIEGHGLPDALERQLALEACCAGAFVVAVVHEVVTDGREAWRLAGAHRVMDFLEALASLPHELAALESRALQPGALIRRRKPAAVASVLALVLDVDPHTLDVVGIDGPWETLLGYPRDRWLSGPTFWQSLLRDTDRPLVLDALHQCRYRRTVRRVRLHMSDSQGLEVVLVGTLSGVAGSEGDAVLRFSLGKLPSTVTAPAARPASALFRRRLRVDSGALAGVVIVAARVEGIEGVEEGVATAEPDIDWITTIGPAVRQFATWRHAGTVPSDLPLILRPPSVDGASVLALLSMLSHQGITPDFTEVGIGWAMLRKDPAAVEAVLSLLVERRNRIALSDVPRTNSDLGILWRWPWSSVVLHRNMVARIIDPATSTAMRALVSITRTIGIDVVADGVDRSEQLQALRGFECDCAQGDAVGKPLPAADFHDLHLAPAGLLGDPRRS